MRSRAALLPTIGDPFLLSCWLKSYKRIFGDEIDQLYVGLGCNIDISVMEYLIKMFESVGAIVLTDIKVWDHGENINRLLEICKEDYLVLLEDDVFVFTPGAISDCFTKVERDQFDIIGSTRGCVGQNIIQREVELWGLKNQSPEHWEYQCPHLWPSLLFTKKSTLLDTDRNFSAKSWDKNEYIEPLKYTTTQFEGGDTFVWASIQLRAKNYRFGYVHQHHNSDQDKHIPGLIAEGKPWTHFGSLSSGILGILQDEEGTILGSRATSNPAKGTYQDIHPLAVGEMARRLSFFKLLAEYPRLPKPVDYFNNIYQQAVQVYIDKCLPSEAVSHFYNIYKPYFGWLLEPEG